MSKENKILYLGLATAAVLPLVLGLLLEWPGWVTVPLFAGVLYGIYRKLMHGTRTASDHVGILLDKIGLHAGNPVRDLSAHRIAKLIEAGGNQAVADQVRQKFDAPRPFV
ncbi:hypothetical protein ABT337_09720 [Saccharopolyspora hirsuta]|uniref:Uncharacterized protein n=1 Tax=Saccharopolyspora hirsuta TaxID=1837 RepID=A0A5M7BPJ6_SACHI|nr:hypothetical protein [Saccharopolyspora hirsuta]KAA5830078.1 hypothetical protein F1721_23510 [Saccharopolyspora hirsuta]MBF6507480.1 hypothetical protein [Nocardia farcinica]